jgi:hypothetical protein
MSDALRVRELSAVGRLGGAEVTSQATAGIATIIAIRAQTGLARLVMSHRR